ncbi:T9SS type A sorting domain-containing protein [Brumimicrobium sp.]|uniref:T9SS type A sorting domain-containing protein n=1 Tax=Brumimicrobium sp. TaxID=2029867 RepID=UPI003A935EB9
MKRLYTTFLAIAISLSASALNRFYVDDDATGNNDGSSWADAFTDLNDALLHVASSSSYDGSEIWIAEGFYTRLSNSQSFIVDNNALLYGGFAGNETDLNQRDIKNHPTIVSGDVGWNDTGAPSSSNSYMMYDNAAHVFKVQSSNRALFDGLIIERAFSTTEAGGGIHVISTSLENLQISNCIIRENVSMNRAGVLYYSDLNGSGFYLFNNRIEDNVNTDGSSSYTIEFRASSSNWTYSDVHFVNNLFKNNSSESSFQMGTCARFTAFGGSDIDLYLTNNTFVDNPQTGSNTNNVSSLIVYQHGGGGSALHAFVNNNIFYNNSGANAIFGESIQGSSVTGELNISNTSSNQNVQDFADNLNLLNTHEVTSSPFVDASNGDYTPIATYQTIGDLTYYDNQYLNNPYPGQEYPTIDLAGNPRFDGQGNLSIGAYQYDETASIDRVAEFNFNVFPNPFTEEVQVDANSTIEYVVIRNTIGQVVYELQEVNSKSWICDLSTLYSGAYFIDVKCVGKKTQSLKIVK